MGTTIKLGLTIRASIAMARRQAVRRLLWALRAVIGAYGTSQTELQLIGQ